MKVSEKEMSVPARVTERLVFVSNSFTETVEVVLMASPAPSIVNWGELEVAPVFWAEM